MNYERIPYMPNCKRLADSESWLTDSASKFTKTILFTFAIGMSFASTTKLYIKNN
jgi:hypothetical protein